jgi:hypothetical protein
VVLALAPRWGRDKGTADPTQSPNILPAPDRPEVSGRLLSVRAQEIAYLAELEQIAQDPVVETMLKRKFGNKG